MISRRSFLSRSSVAAAAAGVLGAPHLAKSAETLLSTPGQRPKRIIHIVSDGMSMGTLTCADLYSQLTRTKLAGIDFKNPSLPLMASADLPEAGDVEQHKRYAYA